MNYILLCRSRKYTLHTTDLMNYLFIVLMHVFVLVYNIPSLFKLRVFLECSFCLILNIAVTFED